MIILDTNVISEVIRPQPDAQVIAWLDSLAPTEIATTSITAAEIRYGVERLPNGRRKIQIFHKIEELFRAFRNRIKAFNETSAEHYAILVTDREKAGRPIDIPDAQIAAICREQKAPLATRNTKDFAATGIELINPWKL